MNGRAMPIEQAKPLTLMPAAEHMPAEHSIQRYLLAGIIIVALVTFGLGGWAALAKLSGAVISQGVLVVDSVVKKVQHPTGGVVESIRVREGDRVEAGDILVQLDPTQTRANATIITNNVDQLMARQARLEAERDGSDQIAFPKALQERSRDSNTDAARSIAAETRLFNIRRDAREGQKSQLTKRTAQLQDEINGYMGQAVAKDKEIDLIHRELEGVRTLWEKNLTPINRLMSLERDAARIEGERSQMNSMIAQAKGKISEIELQIIQIGQDLRSEVGKDLIETRSKITELAERKTAAVDQLNRIDIRAPQSGIVHELAVHTVGGVINPGEQIMLLVPDRDTLDVEVKIAPHDINDVHVGQSAMLRFSAFNQRTTPEIKGTVRFISADLNQDQRTGNSYYTVRIAPRAEEIAKLGSDKIVPGMPVDAFIETGTRTALAYLIKPLMEQASRAFKEK
jgi:HlyD family secretion protein